MLMYIARKVSPIPNTGLQKKKKMQNTGSSILETYQFGQPNHKISLAFNARCFSILLQ